MESLVKEITTYCFRSGEEFDVAMRKLITATEKKWTELQETIACVRKGIERYPPVNKEKFKDIGLIFSDLVEHFIDGLKKGLTRQEVVDYLADIDDEPDKDLSPRQYGEQLGWGKCGRPYKPWRCSYIPSFKRNLPYQKRAG